MRNGMETRSDVLTICITCSGSGYRRESGHRILVQEPRPSPERMVPPSSVMSDKPRARSIGVRGRMIFLRMQVEVLHAPRRR